MGLLWMRAGPSCFLPLETGMSGNFLSCSKGVKDHFEVPEVRCDLPRDASADMASSRLAGRTSCIFSSWYRCSRLKTGTSRSRSGGLRKVQSPCELLGGLSVFLSLRCWGLRPCVESVPKPEDSSPVLTWILGYSGVSPGASVLVLSRGMHVHFPPEL